MSKSIYLINPSPDMPSYYSTDVLTHLGFDPMAFIADLAITTVAALVPADFDVEICDQYVSMVKLDYPADFVGITGKISQVGNMIKLAQEFRRRGKTVIIGGSFASLTPDAVRPYCDILVRGEIETIAPQLFADLKQGRWQAEYTGDMPDLSLSPIPRWDLYPNHKALQGCIQTSRGCPFECEFCDVIQYVGRKQRHKAVAQVLAELEVSYKLGYRHIFLADDNFTVYRQRSKELLTALRDWNNRQTEGQVIFNTQLSIDTAKEDEILQLCFEAGLNEVFIGIEIPNEASLRESKKRQNLGINLVDQIQRFLDHGIEVFAGMIVGFDADGPDIFERQYEFAMSTPIPTFSLGALIAPSSTPLYQRLKQANRLESTTEAGADATPWETNIIPKQMTREELMVGLCWLGNRLYHPAAFGERLLRFIDSLNTPGRVNKVDNRPQNREAVLRGTQLIRRIPQLGPEESLMFSRVMKKVRQKPAAQKQVMSILFRYMQIRYMYEQNRFWEPHLAEQPAPDLSRKVTGN
ncbi:MAG: B12-binding domain-containing radical SAM protein [Ketobacter sp.]|nr:B12-binding domain-containing radical SAM protein [Ketobacter sp.]